MQDSFGAKNAPQYSGIGGPADAADLSQISNYAAQVGNRKVGTSTDRDGLTGLNVWEGLLFGNTTTGQEERYIGGSWVPAGGPPTTSIVGADGNATINYSVVKKSFDNIVTGTFQATRTNSTTYATNLIVGILPVGFRPTTDVFAPAATYGSGTPNTVLIGSNGVMTLQTASPAGHTAARVNFSFPIL